MNKPRVLYIFKHDPFGIGGGATASRNFFYAFLQVYQGYDFDVLVAEELLEKIPLGQAAREGKEGGLKAAAWLSSVPYQASGIIRDKLKEESMDKLYLEIEIPLVYSLYSMEKLTNTKTIMVIPLSLEVY